jgi:hypothetical protein
MKNIRVLPTDKPSRLVKIKDNLWYTTTENIPGGVYQHMYITSDEEIKEGDWFYCPTTDIVNHCESDYHSKKLIKPKRFKIILTTDPDLIKDGVQPIDDEFLEWFVKNPSCEEVEVYREGYKKNGMIDEATSYQYKIIIPKEEPKQETLEEAAEQYVIDESYLPVYKEECERSFKNGALWQAERMYSEENLREAILTSFLLGVDRGNYSKELEDKLIEQFKKK